MEIHFIVDSMGSVRTIYFRHWHNYILSLFCSIVSFGLLYSYFSNRFESI